MSDKEPLLPVYHTDTSNVLRVIFKIMFPSVQLRFYRFAILGVASSILTFAFCVLWSIIFNFEEANATHCSVENYLPSISAAIGHFSPQTHVWRCMILLQIFLRLKFASMYLQYYYTVIYDNYSKLCYFVWLCHTLEIWSLFGLSFVTSTTNYTFHAFCFIIFLFSSMIYMVLSCYLLKFKRKIPAGNFEARILKWKFNCFLFNCFCFLMAGYFFKRHNAYCEPRVYSLFALFEYGVVLSNMIFHLFAMWDLHDRILKISLTGKGVRVELSPPLRTF